MERISTFDMAADMATLQSALGTGELPGSLGESMRALVQRVADRVAREPVSLYLCSPDEHADVRDHFAYLLARTLSSHIPEVLLVDCDFLDVGLHGLVPEADALGFLDLLLYGSSTGVVTQQAAGGVKVVGAGSFPVTKRMPFVSGAFDDATRRLVNHARCVVYVGPLYEDDGDLHPLIGAVDMPVLLRELTVSSRDSIDPVEERIAATWEVELTSVRLVSPRSGRPVDDSFSRVLGDDDDDEIPAPVPAPPPPPVTPPPPPPPVVEPPRPVDPTFAELADTGSDDSDLNLPPEEEPTPAPPPEPAPEPPVPDFVGVEDAPRRRRVAPVAIVIALVATVAAVWWIGRDRLEPTRPVASNLPTRTGNPSPGETDAPAQKTPDQTPDQTSAEPTPAVTAADTSAPSPPPAGTSDRPRVVEEVVEEPRYVDPADTGGRSGGTVLLNSHDIHVMADLQTNWPDAFFIHISSFRRSVEARDEVAYLESREFPVFIVFLDLEAKGKWYRVYAGPFATRDEAREVKKSLDDIPRVRFTRITKISE